MDPAGITVNRISNKLGHLKTNCYYSCKNCNCHAKRAERAKLRNLIKTEHYENQEDFLRDIKEAFGCDMVNCIKEKTKLKAIFTSLIRFVDVRSYLGAGCNLEQYLAMWSIKTKKGVYPYDTLGGECTQQELLERLDNPTFFSREDFNNDMRGTVISQADYDFYHQIWIDFQNLS